MATIATAMNVIRNLLVISFVHVFCYCKSTAFFSIGNNHALLFRVGKLGFHLVGREFEECAVLGDELDALAFAHALFVHLLGVAVFGIVQQFLLVQSCLAHCENEVIPVNPDIGHGDAIALVDRQFMRRGIDKLLQRRIAKTT